MNSKILVITGPTATGKTKLAVRLAKKFDGELISADSRQVYKGLDIGTGKDLDLINKIIWGYDIVDPKKDFSVADYSNFANSKIEEILKRNKLPILVGGTGLYIKSILDGIETLSIPQNKKLRKTLENKSASELFIIFKKLNSKKALSLNNSDKHNSRRLIRAIEIVEHSPRSPVIPAKEPESNTLLIGLFANKELLNKRIKSRVQERLDQGFEKEINDLLKSGVTWECQSMSSLGYSQWQDYLNNKINREEAIINWIKSEQKYAKRQMTWFKKDKRINWFNVENKKYQEEVERTVHKWYPESEHGKQN